MREKKWSVKLYAFLCILVLLIPLTAAAEEEEEVYLENEWNYVDQSMDISGGIPKDAKGRLLAIREAGKLMVATEPYYPPQEFIDPSNSGQRQFVGADIELARRIATRMGVDLEIVPLEFNRVLQSVAEGKYDLAISALAYTPGRTGSLELSKGYYFSPDENTNTLLIREEDKKKIRSLEDLENRNIIAQSGSLQESLAADSIFNYHEFQRVSSVQDVYAAVRDEKSDAGIVDRENAEIYIKNNPKCGLYLVPDIRFELEEQYRGDRIAAKKGELELMYFVNGVIDEVLESGEYREWFERYSEYADRIGS